MSTLDILLNMILFILCLIFHQVEGVERIVHLTILLCYLISFDFSGFGHRQKHAKPVRLEYLYSSNNCILHVTYT